MQKNTIDSDYRSGFVAIAGTPNVGKSTLLNRVLGEKITITSKKPQTTRNRILGVVSQPSFQLVFIDTPGIHTSKKPLNIRIVDAALSALGDVDIILIVIDVAHLEPESEEIILKKLKSQEKPVVLALNKIDLIKKNELLAIIEKWSTLYPFKAILPVSAKDGTQIEELMEVMAGLLPVGPPLFPEDYLTDMSERFLAAELIREKVFRLTGQEIPYSTAVVVDAFSTEKKGNLVKIQATIHVEQDSQKGIIIGKRGSKLKAIGEQARKEIEQLVGKKVFLELFVRVQKNWSKDAKAMERLGY
ncbi:MAG: GTPase Era [Deltaproteobacteria bacterium]|nr:GTPase Era [Deltaproteobacteria bacterium]